MAIRPIGQSSNILQVFRQNQAAKQNNTNKISKGKPQDTVEISPQAQLKFQATKGKLKPKQAGNTKSNPSIIGQNSRPGKVDKNNLASQTSALNKPQSGKISFGEKNFVKGGHVLDEVEVAEFSGIHEDDDNLE